MRDDNFRPACHPLPRSPLLNVNKQSTRGASNIEVVHRVGHDAWKLRAAERGWSAAFGRGHDLANGASTQSASAKRESFVKAIV